MKTLLTPFRSLATLLLLGTGLSAGAQSLGTPRSEAWLGRPLELSIPARLAAADGRDECVHADVFYGDTRLPPSQVKASVTGSGDQRRVRVQAEPPIDEAVVTVAVRAGCSTTVSRSYTLLPELPSEQMLAAMARSMQPGGIMTAALPTQTVGGPAAGPAELRPALATGLDTAPRLRPARLQRVSDQSSTAQLQVEAWQPDGRTGMRVSAHLADPAGDVARRATAALLWQALNADPADFLRSSANLQKLEGEMAQLRQLSAQTRSDMVSLRQQLGGPTRSSFTARLTPLLALLVLLAGGTSVFLWLRNTRAPAAGRWTGAPVDAGRKRAAPQPEPQQPPQPMQFAPSADGTLPPAGVPAADRVALRGEPPSRPGPVAEAGPLQVVPAPEQAPAFAARPIAASMLSVETLAATFDEVDFLASLGLWNDAMDVLKTYLEDSAGPAPMAYYELMRLYVNTDDAASLVTVRKRYMQVYGVEAPRFEQINGRMGLEGYPDMSTRVSRAWGTPQALDVLEQCLFSVPAPGKAFSLQAGRELLFLHDVAKALLTDMAGATADEEGHALAPWANAEDAAQAEAATRDASDVTGGHRFALDVDLSAGADELAVAAPAPVAGQPRPAVPAPVQVEDEVEDAFSAAVALETRRPAGRY